MQAFIHTTSAAKFILLGEIMLVYLSPTSPHHVIYDTVHGMFAAPYKVGYFTLLLYNPRSDRSAASFYIM